MAEKSAQELLPAFEHFAALLNWRGRDRAGAALARDGLTEVLAFARDLQGIYRRAASRQLETLLEANERMSELASELIVSKSIERSLALEFEITSALSRAAHANAAAWAEMGQQLVERSSGVYAKGAALLLSQAQATKEA